jgi:hypothetical protein
MTKKLPYFFIPKPIPIPTNVKKSILLGSKLTSMVTDCFGVWNNPAIMRFFNWIDDCNPFSKFGLDWIVSIHDTYFNPIQRDYESF